MKSAYLLFHLSGDMAMWRNPYEPVGSFSSLGPSPSQIAGLLGAAMGFAAPCSQAAGQAPASPSRTALEKKGLRWPVSPELLEWQETNAYAVTCRWLGGVPRRLSWNVNGIKDIAKPLEPQPLRLQQQVIDRPAYQVAVRLNSGDTARKAAAALANPAFPLYLGASFCRAVVRDIRVGDSVPPAPAASGWAAWKADLAIGELTPFSCHVVNPGETAERIVADGFWLYPTPMHPAALPAETDPCLPGFRRLQPVTPRT